MEAGNAAVEKTWDEEMLLLKMETNGQPGPSLPSRRRRARERRGSSGGREAGAGATHVFQSARAWRGVMHCPIEAQARERRRWRGRRRTFTHARSPPARSLAPSHRRKNLCQRSSLSTLSVRPTMLPAIAMTDRPTQRATRRRTDGPRPRMKNLGGGSESQSGREGRTG